MTLTKKVTINTFNEQGRLTGQIEKEVPVKGDELYSVAKQKFEEIAGSTPASQEIETPKTTNDNQFPIYDELTR